VYRIVAGLKGRDSTICNGPRVDRKVENRSDKKLSNLDFIVSWSVLTGFTLT